MIKFTDMEYRQILSDTVKEVEEAWKTSDSIYAFGYPSALVGSVYIVGEGNDIDVLVLVDDLPSKSWDRLRMHGFEHSSSGAENTYPICAGGFESFRKKDINLLVVDQLSTFMSWKMSAEVCKALNLSNRTDRVIVHRIIMDSCDSDSARVGLEVSPSAILDGPQQQIS